MKYGETKFYLENSVFKNVFSKLILQADEIYISVAWTTNDHSIYRQLSQNKQKIKKFYCGIARNLTSPEVLEDFKEHDDFKIVNDTELMHHKFYMFKYKDDNGATVFETLVGSANLTANGFANNYEIMQHSKFSVLVNVFNEIDTMLAPLSFRPSQEFIDKYKIDFIEAN
jgi:HKD family nuclease